MQSGQRPSVASDPAFGAEFGSDRCPGLLRRLARSAVRVPGNTRDRRWLTSSPSQYLFGPGVSAAKLSAFSRRLSRLEYEQISTRTMDALFDALERLGDTAEGAGIDCEYAV